MKTKHILLFVVLFLSSMVWAKSPSMKTRLKADTTIFKTEELTKKAEYPRGGITAMTQFLANNVKYPESLYGKKIKGGRVMAEFVVEKDGSISDIHVVKSLGKEFDEEVLRVISEMPKWKPAEIYYKDETYKVRTIQQAAVEFK